MGMRLIDADNVLKALGIFNDREHGDPHFLNGIETAREIVEQSQTIGGWISVKDRLPEVGKVVLAFGTRSATTGMFQGVGARNDCWWWKGHTIKHVSYWMPLPEPPKDGDGDAR